MYPKIKQACFIITRIWRYLNLYFLKPFDAVNDTLTASLIHHLDWNGKVIELGAGDGEYSYIMHGGKFPLWFDRYLTIDLSKQDIFDTHKNNVLISSKKLSSPTILVAVDTKENHVKKINEIAFVQHGLVSSCENLPFEDNSIEKIFYYTPHGLNDHDLAFTDACRVLKKGGIMLVLRYHNDIEKAFSCYHISTQAKKPAIKQYFHALDNGRHDEITKMAKTMEAWQSLFKNNSMEIMKTYKGLSSYAWKAYDIQTRPFLKHLIKFFNYFPMPLRSILKFMWVLCWYPFILLFYFIFANDIAQLWNTNCYVSFELKKS